jgi:protein-S-isoprenylcysteine O-methyltransferase Ste14
VRAAALVAGAPAYFAGLALMLWGRITLGEMYNVSSAMGAQLYADHRLVTSGPFAVVRHPMYVGGIMAELGALLLFRSWAAALVALQAPVLIVRARREEEALAAEFGAAWAAYCARVPGWLPRRTAVWAARRRSGMPAARQSTAG